MEQNGEPRNKPTGILIYNKGAKNIQHTYNTKVLKILFNKWY